MTRPKINLKSLEKSHWSQEDKDKAEAVVDFVQLLMNDHNFDEITQRFGEYPYTQHNRSMADGIEGVVNPMRDFVKIAPEFSYEVKHIFVDGEDVILHSHATIKARHRGNDSRGLNIMDRWKVVDGRLQAHWDAVQAIDFPMRLYGLITGGKVKNTNGVF